MTFDGYDYRITNYQRSILDKIIKIILIGNIIGLILSVFRQNYISFEFIIAISVASNFTLITLYMLNKNGVYYFTANVVIVTSGVVFYVILFNTKPADYDFMIFLLLAPILLSLILLNLKETIGYFIILLIAIIFLPVLTKSGTSILDLSPAVINFTFIGTLIMYLIYYQNFLEVLKQKQLSEKETELKNKDQELQQGQKMEAIGRLAGGIAHDFNNILSVILGYIDLSLYDVDDDEPIHNNLLEIRKAGERGKSLIDQLLTFSRKRTHEVQVVELNEIINDMKLILKQIVGQTIELDVQLRNEDLFFKCDQTQVNQIIMNLVQNARDAISQIGKITIRTFLASHKPRDQECLKMKEEVLFTVLQIEDTGTGIPEDVLEVMYEPFFTTKEAGKGTGLGLSMVYGIVTQHGGFLEVSTVVGKGTIFTIYFPNVTISSGLITESVQSVYKTSNGFEDKVLLVAEDDEQVRTMMIKILETAGYKVITANDGDEAKGICDDLSQKIDLMITDVVMPNLSGPDLAQYSTLRRPEMKILLISGYPESELFELSPSNILIEDFPYLKKPFSNEDLLEKLQDLLSTVN